MSSVTRATVSRGSCWIITGTAIRKRPVARPYGECFVLTVNEPVSQFSPVQLTYSVKLTDTSTEPGTYGQYDADGSEGLSGLYTNNQAVLLPVATGERVGEAELFPMPTVSYTVEKTGGTQPGDTGDADTDADNGSKGSGTKTGDDFNMLAFVGAALAAAAAAGATVLIRRRKLIDNDGCAECCGRDKDKERGNKAAAFI